MGKWDHKPTYESAAEWITALGESPTFDDVVGALEKEGSDWIRSIESKTGKFQPHTFIFAAYVAGRPHISIISNTHSTKGTIARSKGGGLRATVSNDSGVHVYVTGLDSAVSRAERALLKRMARYGTESKVIRHRLARINFNASQQIQSQNGISPSCICYSVDSHGGGDGETYGKVVGSLVPMQILNGKNMTELLQKTFNLGPNAQIVQSAFATTTSSNAIAKEYIDCALDLTSDINSSNLTGHDFGDINNWHIEISSANDLHSIVGTWRNPVNAPPHGFVWIKGQPILDLGTLGGPMSNATDINDMNVVVGSSNTSGGHTEAFMWRNGGPLLKLGTLDGNNSGASAVNDHAVVVGNIYRSPSTPQTAYQRAFRWTESQGMTLIHGVNDTWSNALDINNRGEILGWSRGQHQMCTFVWSEAAGLRLIEGAVGRPFYGSCINDLGFVAGEGDDENGVRRAMLWNALTGLKILNIPFSFHPTAIDNLGNIAGHDSDKPWANAWLFTAEEELVRIPGGRDHSVEAKSIVGGAVFGSSRKEGWKHVHPMRWDFNPPV